MNTDAESFEISVPSGLSSITGDAAYDRIPGTASVSGAFREAVIVR